MSDQCNTYMYLDVQSETTHNCLAVFTFIAALDGDDASSNKLPCWSLTFCIQNQYKHIGLELILVLTVCVAGDWSHKPCSIFPILSARPTVIMRAEKHHCLLAGTKLYCLVMYALGCEQLPRVVTQPRPNRESNPWPLGCKLDVLHIVSPCYTAG